MKLPEIPTDPESLSQLSKSELVQLIISQQKIIEKLRQEIAKLKISRDLDSQTSSKPPSTDLLKKSEKESQQTEAQEKSKRKPGGQPGHPGKTRLMIWSCRPLRNPTTRKMSELSKSSVFKRTS